MKKTTIIAFLGTLMLCSCFSFKMTTYDVGLTNVECPKDAKQQFSESMVKKVSEEGQTKYSYEDDMIAIIWYVSSTQFNFTLKNKTNHSIKIPWDEVAYINSIGESKRCIHSGIKLIDRNNAQAPTTIAKNSTLNDLLIPADNIYYVSGKYGGWEEKNLFKKFSSQEEADNSNLIGTKVSILFPIIIENVTNEYTFQFEVKNIIVK